MILGGEGGSKILWTYTFPLIAFFLFGKGEGLFWSAIILFVTLLAFWGPLQGLTDYAYAPQFKIRFITTYLIVSAVTYWFENFRYHYRLGIEEKNRNLEEEKERLKHEINERRRLEKELQFTVSIGITDAKKKDTSFATIMKRADEALYQAKAGGRNRVVYL